MTQVVVVALFPVGVLFIAVLSGPRYPIDFFPRVEGVAILFLGFDITFEAILSVRDVRIDPSGITFVYIFHKERGVWANLRPGEERPIHGMWYLIRDLHNNSRLLPFRTHQITFEQTRAILSYPSCPEWQIPGGFLAQIGVSRIGPAAP